MSIRSFRQELEFNTRQVILKSRRNKKKRFWSDGVRTNGAVSSESGAQAAVAQAAGPRIQSKKKRKKTRYNNEEFDPGSG